MLKENELQQKCKNNLMHNLIFNKNDSRICFFKLQIQRKQRHSSELRHSLIAYPIKTKLVLDKKNDGNYWIIDTPFLLLTK